MFRIAIVEDNEKSREGLKSFLQKYQKEKEVTFEVTAFSDGKEIVENYRSVYDVIFLDIQMKGMDGMTAAKEIRKADENVILIFITNMAQYAIQGYAVNATSYILKPVSYFTFEQQMNKTVAGLKKRASNFLMINTGGGMRRLELSEVFYMESEGHYITIYTSGTSFSILESMKNMEKQLMEKPFFRCNSGYIVNLAHIESVEQNIVTVGGQQLQISRAKKKAFMSALTDYLGGNER